MFLGIEIGGTKLQLAVGDGESAELVELVREDVVPEDGAAGILQQIKRLGANLLSSRAIRRVGIGFGGPVDVSQGRVIRSHQISGWDNFHLTDWCRETFRLPLALANDCHAAALAEARFGAGQGRRSVFYVTVGTGVGGGFVKDGQLMGAERPAASELGHLRPGLHADQVDATVESLASGWGIAAAAQERVTGHVMHKFPTIQTDSPARNTVELYRQLANAREADQNYAADLLDRCECNVDHITAELVAQAAADGNVLAQSILGHACQALGWAIAQTITLLAPEIVVIGGGVSSMGEQLFLAPVRRETARYVFPPLSDSYVIEPAALGESVVAQGAVLLASLAGGGDAVRR
jgi:glucokinase